MADNWFLARDGKKYGPYTSAQMRQMASGGQLLPIDMVLEEGTTKWTPAAQVETFFPATGITAEPPPPPLPPPLAPETAEWHYTQQGQQAGPVTWTRLREIAVAGQLQATDMVWKAGMPAWAAASTVSGLFPTPPAAPPPLPPALPTASLPALIDRVSGEIACRGQQGGLTFGPAQYEVLLDGQKVGIGSVTGGFSVSFETAAGQHTLLLVRDHGVGNEQFPLDLQNPGHYAITLSYPAKKQKGFLASMFDAQAKLAEAIGLPKQIDITHSPQMKKLPRAVVVDADAVPVAEQETLVQKGQRERAGLRAKVAAELADLQQKRATEARRAKLHGLWEPVNFTSQWFMFTKDGGMMRGDGFATKFRWVTDDKLELYEDGCDKTAQFLVLSLGDVELILKVGDTAGHFKKGVTITEAELQRRQEEARRRRAEAAQNFKNVAVGVASVLAAGGFAVLCGAGALAVTAGASGGDTGTNVPKVPQATPSSSGPRMVETVCKDCSGKGWTGIGTSHEQRCPWCGGTGVHRTMR